MNDNDIDGGDDGSDKSLDNNNQYDEMNILV